MIDPHSPPGGPVFETGLKPRGGRVIKLTCGCRSDDYRWLAFCELARQDLEGYKRGQEVQAPAPAGIPATAENPELGG